MPTMWGQPEGQVHGRVRRAAEILCCRRRRETDPRGRGGSSHRRNAWPSSSQRVAMTRADHNRDQRIMVAVSSASSVPVWRARRAWQQPGGARCRRAGGVAPGTRSGLRNARAGRAHGRRRRTHRPVPGREPCMRGEVGGRPRYVPRLESSRLSPLKINERLRSKMCPE